MDLGNKQTKLKSSKNEYVLPSQILNGEDMPQQLSDFGKREILITLKYLLMIVNGFGVKIYQP
ncbi:hypothetical protein V8V50_09585 [Ligilactobacillus salivarius]